MTKHIGLFLVFCATLFYGLTASARLSSDIDPTDAQLLSAYNSITNGCHDQLPVDQWIKKGCGKLSQLKNTMATAGCHDTMPVDEWIRKGCGEKFKVSWTVKERQCFRIADPGGMRACLGSGVQTSQLIPPSSPSGIGDAAN